MTARGPGGVPVGGALAVAGTVTVGVARICYEDFYRATGTTLDAVGLTNGRLVTLGATLTLALIGLTAALVLPGVLTHDTAARRRPGKPAVLAGSVVAVLVAVLVALPVLLGLHFFALPAALLAAAVGLAVLLLLAAAPRSAVLAGRVRGLGLALAALVAVLVAWQGADGGAADAGRSLADGRPLKGAVPGLLDVVATPVCVTDTRGNPVPGLDPAQLLLGTQAGVHVLLHPGPGARATTVPAGAVLLLGRPPAEPSGLPHCP